MVSRERIKKIILEELDQNVLELFCRLESNSEGREIAELNIKFKPFGVAKNKYLRKLIADVKKIDGVLAFIIRKSRVMDVQATGAGETVGIGEGTNN